MTPTNVARRNFLKTVAVSGSALAVGVTFDSRNAVKAQDADGDTAFEPSLWLAIHDDGSVKIWAHRSEMGTGIRTSLPMVVADELEADWDRVEIMQAIGDKAYGSQNTDGSRSIRRFFDTMRVAGSSARLMLERAAAQIWGVDASDCKARLHRVYGPGGKQISFGALVSRARDLDVPKEADLVFKKPSQRRYVGNDDVRFYDGLDVVTGKATYGADLFFEDMLTAVIWRTPTLHGTIKSFDDSDALTVPGVKEVHQIPKFVVMLDGPRQAPKGPGFQALGGIAVLAEDTWAANVGCRKLKVDWDPGKDADFTTKQLFESMRETAERPGVVKINDGDYDAAIKSAAKTHSAAYSVPMLAHASMEMPCAIAQTTADSCEVWAPTQNPQAALDTLAAILQMPKEKITVNVTLLGGGFGRKSKPDYIVEAALLSRMRGGKPVRVQWTREDDIRQDYYHSPAAEHLSGGLDEKGKPIAWLQRSVFPSIFSTFDMRARSGTDMELGLGFLTVPYQIPNLRAENGPAQAPARIGWLRSVCHIFHTFAECSFIDELAHLSGSDNVEFILEAIGEDRHIDRSAAKYPNHGEPAEKFPIDTGRLKNVLRIAADKIDWKNRPQRKGRGVGIATHRSFLSYAAVAVEVEVSKDGELVVPRVEIVLDCGVVVNPDRVRSQMEGGIVFAHGIAMENEITMRRGRVSESNFDGYRIPRMRYAPTLVNPTIVESNKAPAGVGEVPVPAYAPALCNAIFAATGIRIRDLPILNHDLSWG